MSKEQDFFQFLGRWLISTVAVYLKLKYTWLHRDQKAQCTLHRHPSCHTAVGHKSIYFRCTHKLLGYLTPIPCARRKIEEEKKRGKATNNAIDFEFFVHKKCDASKKWRLKENSKPSNFKSDNTTWLINIELYVIYGIMNAILLDFSHF